MKNNLITCYEHEKLLINSSDGQFTETHLNALEKWISNQHLSEDGVPYFTLVHNGIKMSSWVGLLQVGNLAIEILPKVSRTSEEPSEKWRELLLRMLGVTKQLPLNETEVQYQNLSNKPLSEIFFTSFITEVKILMHKGFLKSYRKETKNRNSLKGKLDFGKNIKHNLVHKEKFYTNATVYDYQSYFNRIIIEAVRSIKNINCVKSEAFKILEDWSDINQINPITIDWQRIIFDRRTEIYKKAMIYAKMILNGFNPNLSTGTMPVISFLFDMNRLFEEYVYIMIKRSNRYDKVIAQKGKEFWKSNTNNVILKPDIIVEKDKVKTVIDTKWKLLETQRPSDADLRQIFAYCHLFDAKEGYLVYPKYEKSPDNLQAVPYKNDDCGCGVYSWELFGENKDLFEK